MDLPTPGTTAPLLTRDPIGTEAEMTPGPDDETPYDAEENRRHWQSFRQTGAGQAVPDRDTPNCADEQCEIRHPMCGGEAPVLGGDLDEDDGKDLLGSITGDTGRAAVNRGGRRCRPHQ